MQAAVQPAARGGLTIVRKTTEPQIIAARQGLLLPDEEGGHYYAKRSHLRYELKNWGESWQKWMLAWLRDRVHPGIPRAYYNVVLGHDLHISAYAELFVRHFHAEQRDPFTGRDTGWLENVGRVSVGKVTTAFRDFEALNLVTDSTTYGDYKFHRPGTSATAEANTDTALIADCGLEATGNQSNPSGSTYQTVATVTADTTETWQEHSLRNVTGAAGGTMMDRSVLSPTVATVNLDTVQFTYILTKTAEA